MLFISVFFGLLCFEALGADDGPSDVRGMNSLSMDYAKSHNLWWLGGNAAGLTLQGLPQQGLAGINLLHTSGTYRRPQEAEGKRHLEFSTEKYTELSNLHVWGAFSYAHHRDQNLQWTDVLFPYNGNPYIFADDRGGDWNKQFFNMSAKLASGEKSGFLRYGASISYQVGSGARQNDPRPLNRLKDLTFVPAFVFTLSDHTYLGLTLNYREFREDIGIRIRNRDDNFRYYQLLGLGEYHSAFMTTFSRFCEGTALGGSLQLNLNRNGFQWINTAGLFFRDETIVDGGTSGQKGGDFSQLTADFGSGLQWRRADVNHMLYLQLVFSQGYGTEFVQEYDPAEFIWFTVFSTVRADVGQREGNLGYTISKPGESGEFIWSYDFALNYMHRNFIYRSPRSEKMHERLRLSVQTHRQLGRAKSLFLSTGLEGGFALQGELTVDPYLQEAGRDIILTQVTEPDFEYLTTDYAGFSLGISHALSFRLHRVINTHLHTKWSYLHPFSDHYQGGRSYFQLGVALNY